MFQFVSCLSSIIFVSLEPLLHINWVVWGWGLRGGHFFGIVLDVFHAWCFLLLRSWKLDETKDNNSIKKSFLPWCAPVRFCPICSWIFHDYISITVIFVKSEFPDPFRQLLKTPTFLSIGIFWNIYISWHTSYLLQPILYWHCLNNMSVLGLSSRYW